MKPTTRQILTLPLAMAALLFTNLAVGANTISTPQDCPVTPYGTLSMDEEFGYGAQAITQCNKVRNHAQVVLSIGHPFLINANSTPVRTSARFFSQLDHLIKNYENVHGMVIGKDVEVAVVLLESGGALAATQHTIFNPVAGGAPVANPFIPLIEEAMNKGIKVYLCQVAARNLGINMANKIPGIEFVPGGHSAVADFQLQGYALISMY
jgi:intracellular sulfur oxidation DsrE/DsrF family protein